MIVTELLAAVQDTHTGTEIGADFSQTDGGVATDGALFVLGLQPSEVLHKLHVKVGLIQLRGQEQHGLQGRDSGNCGPGKAKDHMKNGLLGGCRGHQWPWALRRPARALSNLPPNLVLSPTQNAEEEDPHISFPFTAKLPVCLHSFSHLSHLLSLARMPSTQTFTPHTLYQLAQIEVTSDLHVAKSNGQFSILT